jgi:hypothetical protein
LDEANLKIFNKFKESSSKGNYAPLHVIKDKVQGFIVQAVGDIPQFTLISEYAGDVDFRRKRLLDIKNDSIMDLLCTSHSISCLVVCPESKGNLAKFISGINNDNPQSIRKMNVVKSRFSTNLCVPS